MAVTLSWLQCCGLNLNNFFWSWKFGTACLLQLVTFSSISFDIIKNVLDVCLLPGSGQEVSANCNSGLVLSLFLLLVMHFTKLNTPPPLLKMSSPSLLSPSLP